MKSYLERQNECGIKVGDKVKVIRKAADFENGWDNSWEPEMDDAVGNEYKVIGNDSRFGLTLNFDIDISFPYFVLSKVVEKTDGKSYLERQNECGIKVGDKVKVIRKAGNYEDGWDNSWEPEMDDAVGNEYKVIGNDSRFGLTLNFDIDISFPYFVLSKVVEKPEQLNPDFGGYDEAFMDGIIPEWASKRISPKTIRTSTMEELTNPDFEGYDTDYMDALIRNAKRTPWQEPKPASGYTATLTFDLTTEDGAEAWRMHNQVRELHSFAFEVLYNLSKNFEREVQAQADRIMMENTTAADDVELAVDILRRLINELSDNYNLNVN